MRCAADIKALNDQRRRHVVRHGYQRRGWRFQSRKAAKREREIFDHGQCLIPGRAGWLEYVRKGLVCARNESAGFIKKQRSLDLNTRHARRVRVRVKPREVVFEALFDVLTPRPAIGSCEEAVAAEILKP